MAKRLFSLIALGLWVFVISFSSFAAPQPPLWKDLKPEEQQALSPIAKDFDSLPDGARENLYKAAQRYPKLTPDQQVRFKNRLPSWAKMHPEERKAAREKYKKFKALPPEKRKEVKEKWHKREATPPLPPSAEKSAAPGSSSSQPATSPATSAEGNKINQ